MYSSARASPAKGALSPAVLRSARTPCATPRSPAAKQAAAGHVGLCGAMIGALVNLPGPAGVLQRHPVASCMSRSCAIGAPRSRDAPHTPMHAGIHHSKGSSRVYRPHVVPVSPGAQPISHLPARIQATPSSVSGVCACIAGPGHFRCRANDWVSGRSPRMRSFA
jgi:hypothetical protein